MREGMNVQYNLQTTESQQIILQNLTFHIQGGAKIGLKVFVW